MLLCNTVYLNLFDRIFLISSVRHTRRIDNYCSMALSVPFMCIACNIICCLWFIGFIKIYRKYYRSANCVNEFNVFLLYVLPSHGW